MAKFKANINFRLIEEKVDVKAGEEFEITIERSKELVKNIERDHPHAGFELTRLDEPEKKEKDTKDTKETEEGK